MRGSGPRPPLEEHAQRRPACNSSHDPSLPRTTGANRRYPTVSNAVVSVFACTKVDETVNCDASEDPASCRTEAQVRRNAGMARAVAACKLSAPPGVRHDDTLDSERPRCATPPPLPCAPFSCQPSTQVHGGRVSRALPGLPDPLCPFATHCPRVPLTLHHRA